MAEEENLSTRSNGREGYVHQSNVLRKEVSME